MTGRDLIARIRGYIGKASFATEADRYTVTTLLDELAATLAREQEAQPAPERMNDLRALSSMALNPPTREEAEAEDVSDVDPAPLLAKMDALRAAQPAAQEPSDDQNT